jgi:hypothetical protein
MYFLALVTFQLKWRASKSIFKVFVGRTIWFVGRMLGWRRYGTLIIYNLCNIYNYNTRKKCYESEIYFTQYPMKGYHGKSWIEKVE